MIQLLAFLAASLLPLPQTAHVEEIRGSVVCNSVQWSQDEQKIKIEMKDVQVRITAPSGAVKVVEILALYDPQTKLFSWTFQHVDQASPGQLAKTFSSEAVLYRTSTELIAFHGGLYLQITASSNHAANLSEGLRQVVVGLDEGRIKVDTDLPNGTILLNLGKELSPSFVHLRNSPAVFPLPKLRGVTKSDNRWRVVLDGPNGDSAVLILNDKYEVISSEVLPRDPSR